jgi:hypothetical protein
MIRMFRAVPILAATVVLLLSSSLVAAQTEITYKAMVKETFGRSSAPSGVGVVQGYGLVTEVFEFLGETPTGDPQCPVTTTGLTTLTFADGSTLTTLDTQTRCTPGASRGAPGSSVSFGNPAKWSGSWVVDSGTGIFEGATGSGTLTVSEGGDTLMIQYQGTLTLP